MKIKQIFSIEHCTQLSNRTAFHEHSKLCVTGQFLEMNKWEESQELELLKYAYSS